jgi:hypothetical protein
VRRAGGQVHGTGAGCAVLIAVAVALGVAVSVPFVAYGVLAGGHGLSLMSRRNAWRQRHEEDHRQALEAP